MNTYIINLETTTFEATEAIIKLDNGYIGTNNYMGIAYFWAGEYKHYLRDASPYQRKRVHKKWLDLNLDFSAITQKHWDIIGEVLREEVPRVKETKMNFKEIKEALDNGRKVYWSNKNYEVIKSQATNKYNICCISNGSCIGLYGTKLNGKEEDFWSEVA